jgi:hypothetical protein
MRRREGTLIVWKLWQNLSLNYNRVLHWFSTVTVPTSTVGSQSVRGRASVWNVRKSKSLCGEKRNPKTDQVTFQPEAHSNGRHNPTGDIATGDTFQPEVHSNWRHIATGGTFELETPYIRRHIPTRGTFELETYSNRRYIRPGDVFQTEIHWNRDTFQPKKHSNWRHIPTEDTLRFIPVFWVPVPKLNPSVTSPAGHCSNYTPHMYVREAADISGSFHEAQWQIPTCVLGIQQM